MVSVHVFANLFRPESLDNQEVLQDSVAAGTVV